MAEGDEPLAQIPVGREDEIGQLIADFDRLATERNRLDEALRAEIAERKQAQDALAAAFNRLQALSQRLTRTQEEERRKVAFELHEQSGQELVTLGLHLQELQAHCRDPEGQDHLRDARALADAALERVRGMSLDLHPPQLEDFGLYVALGAHCRKQADAAGWALHFDAPAQAARPNRDLELACFRVAQEALVNVARHAHASEVWVSFQQDQDQLRLSVRDNGKGFDAAGARERLSERGLGLMGMEERVRQASGRLEIRSSPGSGTEIRAVFPLAAGAPGVQSQASDFPPPAARGSM
ncbi:MAG: sensor histidine kinase [Betaproteobacteria bacterium]|nr:sensor histidine kinase [Betaproteobacteria bacterium]